MEMIDFTLEQRLEKRAQTQALLREQGISAWILWVEDNAAEQAHLPLIAAPYGTARKAYVITPDRAVALCPTIESDLQQKAGFEVIEFPHRDVLLHFEKNFKEIVGEKPTSIALNFSDTFGALDTLGAGNYRKIKETISKQYFFPRPEEVFVSADTLIIAAASSKLPFEVELLRQAAQLTFDVLEQGFRRFRSGMSEQEAAAILHSITEEKMASDPCIGYSWKKEFNPIVLTGEGIAGSPHAAPSERIIRPGNTVYVDFGLSVHGYGGDIQHFGYVVREGESKVPEPVQRMYDLLIQSIEAGMKAAIPGASGWQVDDASRQVITGAGYPSYAHATGHQLGAGTTHAPGATFKSRFEPNGREVPEAVLPLQRNFVMTIEPRIQIPNGASIEVDGVITDRGLKLLAPMQKEIYLIQ